MSVTDRVGQVWEFYDGMIIWVIASEPYGSDTVIHDVLVLSNVGAMSFASGTFSPRWHEKSAWERTLEDRMRFDDIGQIKMYESNLSLNDEDWCLIVVTDDAVLVIGANNVQPLNIEQANGFRDLPIAGNTWWKPL